MFNRLIGRSISIVGISILILSLGLAAQEQRVPPSSTGPP